VHEVGGHSFSAAAGGEVGLFSTLGDVAKKKFLGKEEPKIPGETKRGPWGQKNLAGRGGEKGGGTHREDLGQTLALRDRE